MYLHLISLTTSIWLELVTSVPFTYKQSILQMRLDISEGTNEGMYLQG
jgi:hypothetical protein